MNRIVLVLFLLLCLVPSQSPAEETALPNDASQVYISAVGEQAQAIFEDPALADLKATCHFVPIDADSKVFAERYATGPYAITSNSAVRVQLADGTVVYQAEGAEVNKNPAVMASCIRLHLLKKIFYPWHKQVPVVVDKPKLFVPPVLIPKENREESDDAAPIYVLIALLAGIGMGELVALKQKVTK